MFYVNVMPGTRPQLRSRLGPICYPCPFCTVRLPNGYYFQWAWELNKPSADVIAMKLDERRPQRCHHIAGRRVPSKAGGRGHLPRPRGGVAGYAPAGALGWDRVYPIPIPQLRSSCPCRSHEHELPRANSLRVRQIAAEPSLLCLRSDHRNCSAAHHAAQSLYLSPPAAIDVARSPQIPIAELAARADRGLHPAISCLGGFRTPAAGACRQIVVAGVRKPAHNRTHAAQQTVRGGSYSIPSSARAVCGADHDQTSRERFNLVPGHSPRLRTLRRRYAHQD